MLKHRLPTKIKASRRETYGTALAELIVAGFLLITGMSLVAQGVVKAYRLHQEMRQYVLAQDELANQLERLTMKLSPMSKSERTTMLKGIEPSEAIRTVLVEAKLTSELIGDQEHGSDWLRLTLEWDRGAPSNPISLVGWIRPTLSKEDSQ